MKVLVINEFDYSKTVELNVAPKVGELMRFDSTSIATKVKRSYPMTGQGEFADVGHDHVVVI